MKRCILLVFLALSWPAFADEQLQHKCVGMAKIAQGIAVDRDRGVTYQTRQQRNKALAHDMPSMKDWLKSMTKAIYFDLANESPANIALAEAQACMNN